MTAPHVPSPADDALTMWTVYDHPRDFPNHFVARCFQIKADAAVATKSVVTADKIETIRSVMQRMGKVCLQRDPNDDPKIVEVWL